MSRLTRIAVNLACGLYGVYLRNRKSVLQPAPSDGRLHVFDET